MSLSSSVTPRRGRAAQPPHPPISLLLNPPSSNLLLRPWLNLPPPHLLPRASHASRWDSITLEPTGGESCESWRCPSCPCFHSPANDIHLLPSCPIAPPVPPLSSLTLSHTPSPLPPHPSIYGQTPPSSPAPPRFHCHPGSPPITAPLIPRAGGQGRMSSELGRKDVGGGGRRVR